jgi:hypothetical protein
MTGQEERKSKGETAGVGDQLQISAREAAVELRVVEEWEAESLKSSGSSRETTG